jgi:hypothetical protein
MRFYDGNFETNLINKAELRHGSIINCGSYIQLGHESDVLTSCRGTGGDDRICVLTTSSVTKLIELVDAIMVSVESIMYLSCISLYHADLVLENMKFGLIV